MNKQLRIGNAQGFWGDSPSGASQILGTEADLDFLTLDYLAEVSLSIMAIQREKDPDLGYARDFVNLVESLIPHWISGSSTKIVCNAGGLNPQGCARAVQNLLDKNHCPKKIAVIDGDDVLSILQSEDSSLFTNSETGILLENVKDKLVTANAYIGSKAIADAVKAGAEIVITGRVADPSMVVGPCMAHFDWTETDYNALAGATIAGHLIECGTQVSGGFSSNWLDIENPEKIGFPIVEIDSNGDCIVTKTEGSGGIVNEWTVKEQLLYEIGDPAKYLSPDAIVSFLELKLKDLGLNRVFVSGARGKAPTDSYKVSATYRNGFRADGMLVISGHRCEEKARRAGEVVMAKLEAQGCKPERYLIECIGAGDTVPGVLEKPRGLLDCVLRIAVMDPDIKKVQQFTRELAPLVTSGPQGTTGYSSGRPRVRPVFAYWPCLIPRNKVTSHMHILN
jgi:hypothetical protein